MGIVAFLDSVKTIGAGAFRYGQIVGCSINSVCIATMNVCRQTRRSFPDLVSVLESVYARVQMCIGLRVTPGGIAILCIQ